MLTVLHTAAHAAVGAAFERGLKLRCQGDYRAAARWLKLAESRGVDHYDPEGVALAALRDCRDRRA